jgi:SAM-dependent methyltransferase
MADWDKYFDAMGDVVESTGTLREALGCWDGAPGTAIDLGCGTGHDTLALLARGWTVHAIDAQQEALTRLLARAPPADRERLSTTVARFELLKVPPADLVNASFSLPFCDPESFHTLWSGIASSVREGGTFCGQFFGVRDDRAAEQPKMTFVSRERVEQMFEGWLLIDLVECESFGPGAVGPAFRWHVFHVVAKKLPAKIIPRSPLRAAAVEGAVPAGAAAFLGQWMGNWDGSPQWPMTLTVLSVSPSGHAKVDYRFLNQTAIGLDARISGGSLTFGKREFFTFTHQAGGGVEGLREAGEVRNRVLLKRSSD